MKPIQDSGRDTLSFRANTSGCPVAAHASQLEAYKPKMACRHVPLESLGRNG
jgi:hypothetical protein